MNNKIKNLLLSFIIIVFSSCFSSAYGQQKDKGKDKTADKSIVVKETKDKPKDGVLIKKDTLKTKEVLPVVSETDTLTIDPNSKLKVYKKGAHASYYHNKFNGRRTASGKRFDNNKYTAAHKKLPFGTIVKVTNESNGKSVIVEINDRGPFSKVREIDLSRRAFMDIASNKNSGSVIVKIEVVEEKK